MKQIKTITVAILALASVSLMSFKVSSLSNKFNIACNAVKVNWVKESHDFGEIPRGKPVSIEFEFTNTGDEHLLIADVATSCGCTASDYTKEPIAPGRSSKVKVSYNAAAAGSFTKTITVNFQDASLKKTLEIKGTVR
ncbi:MAG: DUF1573 domain-containing protein [Chitinophagaceae bacterium]|nr:DUF1573 domain-containing protein [Chitinophagaceae bacterium]